MQAMKAKEQSQDFRYQDFRHPYTNLDKRYGKIGISAVAAAVRHQSEPRNATESRSMPYDRD
jgi:hypothetical protein